MIIVSHIMFLTLCSISCLDTKLEMRITVETEMDDEDCLTQNDAMAKKDDDITSYNGMVPQKVCFDIFKGLDNDDDAASNGGVPKKDEDTMFSRGVPSKMDEDIIVDCGVVPKKGEDIMTFNGTVLKKDEDVVINDGTVTVLQKSYFDFFKGLEDDGEDVATYSGTMANKSNLDLLERMDDKNDVTNNGAVPKEFNSGNLECMVDEDVATYDGITIKKSDLDSLQEANYLSDNVIGFYFSYLSSIIQSTDIFLVSPSLSFLLATLPPFDESYKALIEPLKLPEKQLIIFTVNDGQGIHWSLLVYHRGTNTFIHHDSIKGQHRSYAYNFYETMKWFVGRSISSLLFGSPSLGAKIMIKKRKKKMKKKYTAKSNYNWNLALMSTIFEVEYLACDDGPLFHDACFTPQQSNTYDCGLYVMAIARAICEWYLNGPRNIDELWFSDLKKRVDPASVELGMRGEVLRLIEDLRNCTLAQQPA